MSYINFSANNRLAQTKTAECVRAARYNARPVRSSIPLPLLATVCAVAAIFALAML